MGLRSIKEIFITGHGPSSSHTMGPYFASRYIVKKYKQEGIKKIVVTLYGSLALTGVGHLTDEIIHLALEKCRELGIKEVLISCNSDNIGSRKSILNNGGVYEETVLDDGEPLEKYWIKLK